MNKETRIVVVDDHPIVAEGLKQLLELEDDLVVCSAVQNAGDAIAEIEKENPDLMIVDISLKGGSSGLELIKTIKAQYPHLTVLTLSMHEESLYAERAIRAGARGYIMKQEMTNTIVKAIRQVMKGKIYLSDELSLNLLDILISSKGKEGLDPVKSLTDREFEVFQLISQGARTGDMADTLHLSKKTIDTYKMRIREKLNLASGHELVKFAIEWAHKNR